MEKDFKYIISNESEPMWCPMRLNLSLNSLIKDINKSLNIMNCNELEFSIGMNISVVKGAILFNAVCNPICGDVQLADINRIEKILFDRVSVLNFSRLYIGYINSFTRSNYENRSFTLEDIPVEIDIKTVISAIYCLYNHKITDNELVYKILYVINSKK